MLGANILVGFFGLDQIAKELEGPFGVDDNDFPLLAMGMGLCDDLDALVKSVGRPRREARTFASNESAEMRKAAKAALGWGCSDKGPDADLDDAHSAWSANDEG